MKSWDLNLNSLLQRQHSVEHLDEDSTPETEISFYNLCERSHWYNQVLPGLK